MTKLERPLVKTYALATWISGRSLWKNKIPSTSISCFACCISSDLYQVFIFKSILWTHNEHIYYCFAACVSPVQLMMCGVIYVFLCSALGFIVLLRTASFHVENEVVSCKTVDEFKYVKLTRDLGKTKGYKTFFFPALCLNSVFGFNSLFSFILNKNKQRSKKLQHLK